MKSDLVKKYFRLFPDTIHVSGPAAGAVYLLPQNRFFTLEPRYNSILKALEKNLNLGEVSIQERVYVHEIKKLLTELEQMQAGCILDQPYFIEKIRPLNPMDDITFFRPAPVINLLNITLSGQCSQDCFFCRSDELTPRLQPCLGCTRSADTSQTSLQPELIKKALEEAAWMGCSFVRLHAGDINLIPDTFTQAAAASRQTGYHTVELMTGTALSEKLIEVIIQYKIIPVFQIFSDKKEIHDEVTGREGSFRDLMLNIRELRDRDAAFKLTYLYTARENNPHEVLAPLQKSGAAIVFSDRLLNVPPAEKPFIYKSDFLIPPGINSYAGQQNGNTCLTGKLALSVDGKYYPCPHFQEHELRDASSSSIQDIFASGTIQDFWWGYDSGPASCTECELRYACFRCKAIPSAYDDNQFICGYNPEAGQWYEGG